MLAAARTAKRPVVGLLGSVIPAELVLAAGCHPVYIAASAEDFRRASAPMETFHEPEIRSLFRQAAAGQFEHCRLLVIASSSDGYRYLFQYLLEMQRTGRGAGIPPLLLYDFQFGDSACVDEYNQRVVRALVAAVSSLGGAPCTDTSLRNAIERCNVLRRSLVLLQRARASGLIAGNKALQLIARIDWSAPEACAAAMDAALPSLRAEAPTSTARLLLAASEVGYHEYLHQLLEASGAQVVVENDEWGSRRAGPSIELGADPLEAIAAHYKTHTCSPRQPTERREAWLRSQFESGVMDALLLYAPPSDQYFGWDCPSLRRIAGASGLPSMLLRSDVLNAAESDRIHALLGAWLATVTPRTGTSGVRSPERAS